MKVLIVGDSPFLKTGFGKVNAVAAKAFADAGWEVGVVSGLSMDPVEDSLGYKVYYPQQGDVLGVLKANEAVYDFKPDLVYHTGEPGTLTGFARVIPARLPLLAYVPIEGEPIALSEWRAVLSGLPIITCSNYGAEVLRKYTGRTDVPVAYHGIDHEVFRVTGKREETRDILGWSDKFVVMTVAANVRRKQHTRLFEAMAILKNKYHQSDIILYDHTVPFDNHWLDGWNLPEVAYQFGILEDIVRFNPAITKPNQSIDEVGKFDGIGLVDLYNAADLFVLPSQVEGFGLPIAEAMACGVPVMVTRYAAGWEVARPAGVGLPVKDWEIHKSGTRYANVDIEAMAKEILSLKRNPRERARRAALGLQRVRDFRWEDFTETLIDYAHRLVEEKAEESRRSQELEDTGNDAGQQTSPSGDAQDQVATKAGLQAQEANS